MPSAAPDTRLGERASRRDVLKGAHGPERVAPVVRIAMQQSVWLLVLALAFGPLFVQGTIRFILYLALLAFGLIRASPLTTYDPRMLPPLPDDVRMVPGHHLQSWIRALAASWPLIAGAIAGFAVPEMGAAAAGAATGLAVGAVVPIARLRIAERRFHLRAYQVVPAPVTRRGVTKLYRGPDPRS